MTTQRRSPGVPFGGHGLTCGDCRRHLLPYIQRELPRPLQLQIGQHIGHCGSCEAEYLRLSRMEKDLRATTPLVGGDGRALSRMWQGIAAQIAHARRKQVSGRELATGLAGIALMIGTALAWAPVDAHAIPPTIPTAAQTEGTPIALAAAPTLPETAPETSTPTPRLQSNYAPTPGATDSG